MKTQAFNPYLPSYEYVPDGEPYVFGDRVYVFGSHDAFNGEGFCINNYVCWSAPTDNLGEWKYEGVIYDRMQDPLNQKGNQFMNAPDVCRGTDGRYYLYYQLHLDKGVSVAVARRPEGPYEFYGHVKHADGTLYGRKKKDAYGFDPAVFLDDDGRIYLYTGFSPDKGGFRLLLKMRGGEIDGGYAIELESDMLTVKGKQYETVPGPIKAAGTPYEGHGFFEASSMRKINGKYYLVYSSILSHELCYAVSDAPVGPFEYGGTLVSIGDIGLDGVTEENARNYTGNTHGGMVEINGQWYIFYHRQTNQQKCARQGCAEPVIIDKNGLIAQVEVTSCGLNGGPLEGKGTYEARIACNLWGAKGTFAYVKLHHNETEHPYFTQSGSDRENNPDQYIANMQNDAVAGFKYFHFKEVDQISIRVRGTGNGKMYVFTSLQQEPVAKIAVKRSEDWEEFSAGIQMEPGVQPLYFKYVGDGFVDFDRFTLQ